MRRRIYFLFPIICMIVSLSANELVSANPIDRPPTLEQSYIQFCDLRARSAGFDSQAVPPKYIDYSRSYSGFGVAPFC